MLPALMLLASCKPNCPEQKNLNQEPIVIVDTVYIDLGLKAKNELLLNELITAAWEKDSIHSINKRLATELMNERLVIQNAKHYVNIVNKNRSQEKFLLGWMNRALKN